MRASKETLKARKAEQIARDEKRKAELVALPEITNVSVTSNFKGTFYLNYDLNCDEIDKSFRMTRREASELMMSLAKALHYSEQAAL
jgi:hypothetical protein